MNAVTDLRPLVAVGVPCGDRVHQEFMQCIWGVGRGAKHHRQGLCVAQSSMIVNARNQLVDAARTIKADYLMFFDSDMTFPYQTIDTLLAYKKDIVGCTYVRRAPPYDLLGATLYPAGDVRTGLVEMSHIPTGCLLIKMSVFEQFTAPIFRFEVDEAKAMTKGEDFVFSEMARARGFRLWCDIGLSYDVKHIMQYGLGPDDSKRLRAQNQPVAIEPANVAH